jgi:hypothetical protein
MITNNIRIIRLHGGEDLIADYIQDEKGEKALLRDPMQVIFKRTETGQAILMMMPWLPIEIIKDNSATLCVQDILTIVEPNEVILKHYGKVILDAQEKMDLNFMDADEEEYGEEYDDDLALEEVLELLKEKRKQNIH